MGRCQRCFCFSHKFCCFYFSLYYAGFLLPNNVCHDIMMMLRCMWRRQNDRTWRGELNEVNVAVQLACEALIQWNFVRTNGVRGEQQVQQPEPVWRPPSEDYIKCNVDAALFGDQQCFGIGMCITDYMAIL